MNCKTVLLMGMTLIAAGLAWQPTTADASVLISDDFNRPQNPTYLGWTDQGYLWYFKTFNAPTPIDISMYHPGIKNQGMYWGPTGNGIGSIAYMNEPGPIKDFRMEFDLTYGGTPANGFGFTMNFRSGAVASQVSDADITPGYALFLNPLSATQQSATLYSDYPASKNMIAAGSPVTVGGYNVHVTLQAQGNNIKVWFGQNQALNYTDNTGNPAATQGGYFSFNANVWKEFTLDNLVISTVPLNNLLAVPEPASMALAAFVGMGLLMRRMR